MSQKLAILLLCSAAGACGGDPEDVVGAGPDAGSDACGAQACPPADAPPPPPPPWSFTDVHGVPNLDDDDGGGIDWAQPQRAADDDVSRLVLSAEALGAVPSGGDVALTLAGDVADVRITRGGQHVLGGTAGAGPYAFAPGSADELRIDFGGYGVAAQLTLDARDPGGATVDSATVTVQAAPLIMNHHLQPAERVWAVRVNGNADLIADYGAALGAKFTPVSGSSVFGDVWIQDELEFSTTTGDQGQRLDVVIDSIRDRGLDDFPESLVGPGTIAETWGVPQTRTTYDSFGNLEASPPVTVNGVAYPFGKIYYGRTGVYGLSTQLADFLASQRVQAPFALPTSWLCVGHVDEFSSFVPDPTSPKGFKLVIADVPSAWTLLAAQPSGASLPLYANDHGYATVGDLLTDANLRALNDDLQADYLDPIVATFKAELGLTEADIIRVPSLFEEVSQCNGRVAALIPGMVNLVVANVDGQTTHLFAADPFFRSVVAQSADPIIAAFTAAMPAGMQLHFLDDWDVYHMGLGEVHCGTNVRRTPTGNWWETAQHLMGSN